MSAIDGVIAAISPSWGAKRAAARAEYERATMAATKLRSYNAVSKGRRAGTDGWKNVNANGPTDNPSDIAELSRRARVAHQNNPYWVSGRRALKGLVVGRGIRCTVIGDARIKTVVQRAWEDWAKSKEVDVTGRLNWYGVQSLVFGCVVDDGEALVIRRQAGSNLQLQVLSGDHLALERDGFLPGEGRILGGVEVDAYSRPVAYHLYDRHPSEGPAKVVRIPAEDVAHVYRLDRPNQLRGVSWIAPVFTRLADWDDYEDSDLMRQKVAACLALIYTGVSPEDQGEFEPRERIEPGMVEFMPAGTGVSTVTPPASPGLKDTALIVHRAIANGLGITYEALTGDYSQVNFASGRLAHLQQAISVREWQRDVMFSGLCDRVFSWFAQAYTLRRGAQNLREVLNVSALWTAQSVFMVDPATEVKANRERVRSGFVSLSEVIREDGRDPVEVFDQLKADQDACDARGLVLDVDARQVSAQGQGSVNQKQDGASSGSQTQAA